MFLSRSQVSLPTFHEVFVFQEILSTDVQECVKKKKKIALFFSQLNSPVVVCILNTSLHSCGAPVAPRSMATVIRRK